MSPFSNTFGEINFQDSCLNINLSDSITIENELKDFLSHIYTIYHSINKPFKIYSDLSKVKLIKLPSRFYYLIIKFFTDNYLISEKYLTGIEIICSSSTICKILNNLFIMYKMPHPINFISLK